MKQTETNQWQKGLNLDTHPIAVTNKDLTSALNATMITMQGDEMVLQNDMGNVRVESAYLPAGYVPVGMQEFGGIVYVASYNPLTHQSQIGSFPSPERNISSDEEGAPTIEIGSFFTEDCGDISTTVKKIKLTSEPLHPGDKYSVEMSDKDQYLDLYKNIDAGIYTLNLAVIDESGNLINISKEDITTSYEVKDNDENIIGNFFIRLVSDHTEIIKDQQFNIYKGKIVGDLYLVLTLTIPQANEFNIYGEKVEGSEDYYDIYVQMPQYSVTNNNGTPIVYNISGAQYYFAGKYKYAFADVNKSNLSITDTFTYKISGLFEESADLDSALNIISKVSIKTLEITESWQETNEGSYKATASGIIKYKGKKYKTDIQLEREDSNDIKPYINTVDPVVYNDVFIGEDHKDSVSYTSMVQTESKKLDDSGNLVITIQKEYTYPELQVQTELYLDRNDSSNLKSVYSANEVTLDGIRTDNIPEINLTDQNNGGNIKFYKQDDYYIKSGVKIIPEYDYSFMKYNDEDALNNDTGGTQLPTSEQEPDTLGVLKLASEVKREGFLKYKVTPKYNRNVNECGTLPQLTVDGIYDLSKLASDTVTFDFDHYFDSVNNVLYLRILNAQTYLKQGSRISGWRFKYRDALLNGQKNVKFASIELPTRNTYGGTYTIQLYPKRSGKTNRGDDKNIPEIVDASVGVCGIKTGEPTIDIDGQTLYFTNDLLLDSILDCDIEIDVTYETDENKKITTTSTSNKSEGSQYIFTFATRVKDGKACIDLDKSNVKIAWINKSLSIDFKRGWELTLPDIELASENTASQYDAEVQYIYNANMLAKLSGQLSVNSPFSLQSDEISESLDEIDSEELPLESDPKVQHVTIAKIPTKLRGIKFKNILTNISNSPVSLFDKDNFISTYAQTKDSGDGIYYTPITQVGDTNTYKFQHWESYITTYDHAHYHNPYWWDKNYACGDIIQEYGTCANKRYNDHGVKNYSEFDRVNPQRLFLMASYIKEQYPSPKYEAVKLASGKILIHNETVEQDGGNFILNPKWNNVYYPAIQDATVQVLKPKCTIVDYTPVYYKRSGTHQTKVKLLYKGVDVDKVKDYCCEGFNLNITEELNTTTEENEPVYYFNYDFNISEAYPSPYTIPKIRDNSQGPSELAVTGFIDAGDKIYITSQRQNILYLDPKTKTIKKCKYLHKTNAGYDTANITLTTKSFGETTKVYIQFHKDEDPYYQLDFFATEDD